MIAAGQTVGNYRILSKIGTGGMGAVYLAEHPAIGKKVAFKVIHRELAGNRDVVSRFFQEAKAVNRIGNEHIIEIHDFGVTPEGDHYYIMEYLEGQTLASLLSRETAIDVVRAMHIGAQIAAALDAAHANGVIHRDLKPDNVMLTPRHGDPDFVKVLDFGLAKMFAAGTGVHTAVGVLLGTPQYMSPEACESKRELDGRTDVYALGVLLFQMMTGVLPFDGDSMGEVLVKQVTTLPPAPRGLNPHIPPSVEQILLRCLAKSPEARFASMGELRDALRDPDSYLRTSPPILPARSIAPGAAGVDAKQVLAYAAAHASAGTRRTADGPSAAGGGGGGGGGGVRPGDMPGLAQPNAPKNHTMRIATPLGYVSRPPRRAWPYVVVVGVVLGLGAGVGAVVLFGGQRGAGGSGSGSGGGSGSGSGSGKPQPVAVTGSGSGSGGPSTVTGSGSGGPSTVTGSGGPDAVTGSGGPDAVTGSGGPSTVSGSGSPQTVSGSGEPSTVSGSGSPQTVSGSGSPQTASGSGSPQTASGSGSPQTASGSGSPPTASGSGSPPTASGSGSPHTASGSASGSISTSTSTSLSPSSAHLALDSLPPGASVYGPDHKLLGKCPLDLTWPTSQSAVSFELRLPGYKTRTKTLSITGNTVVRVDLDKLPPAAPHHPPAPPHHPHPSDGVVRPGDI